MNIEETVLANLQTRLKKDPMNANPYLDQAARISVDADQLVDVAREMSKGAANRRVIATLAIGLAVASVRLAQMAFQEHQETKKGDGDGSKSG